MTYAEASTKQIGAANGVDYSFREVGDGAVPLVLLQHFRGNLDNWDPALVDALGSNRRVITFNKLYPDSAHGFLFQHHAEFAADVEAFLSAA